MANELATIPRPRFARGMIASAVGYILRPWLSTSQAVAGSTPTPDRDFGGYRVRLARYGVLWALYENTAYDAGIHRWADAMKADRGLYPHIRNILNVVYRVVEFWATHTWCGAQDPDCGDGKTVPSAIPIVTANPDIPPVIARIFRDSDIESLKTLIARLGAALGDVGIFAVDDPASGKVYLQAVDPNTIADYREALDGTPEFYAIEEWRPDPRTGAVRDAYGHPIKVVYREEGRLIRDEGGSPNRCQFNTFLGDQYEPYQWPGTEGSAWTEPYPFLPLTLIAHTKILPGCPFGQAEALPVLSKIREIDEVASRFHGFVAKAVDTVWLLKGFSKAPEMGADLRPDALKAIIGGPDIGAQALLSSLDLSHVDGHLKLLMDELKDDFPELRRDIESAAGDASGTALRKALGRLEDKGQTRRSGYDAGLVKAITQCLRIGGIRRYDGFDAFAADAVEADPSILSFRIDKRPLFTPDPLDALIIDEKFWAVAESADRAGCPLPAYLEIKGWAADKIAVVVAARDKAMADGLGVGRSKQAPPPNDAAATAIQSPGGAAP